MQQKYANNSFTSVCSSYLWLKVYKNAKGVIILLLSDS